MARALPAALRSVTTTTVLLLPTILRVLLRLVWRCRCARLCDWPLRLRFRFLLAGHYLRVPTVACRRAQPYTSCMPPPITIRWFFFPGRWRLARVHMRTVLLRGDAPAPRAWLVGWFFVRLLPLRGLFAHTRAHMVRRSCCVCVTRWFCAGWALYAVRGGSATYLPATACHPYLTTTC